MFHGRPAAPPLNMDIIVIGQCECFQQFAFALLILFHYKVYARMAVYLRWAMERGQMSNPFLTQYRNVVETVRAGNGPDLRVFIRDKLDGKLSTQFFDRVGSGFAQWYAQDNRSNPYVYLWD